MKTSDNYIIMIRMLKVLWYCGIIKGRQRIEMLTGREGGGGGTEKKNNKRTVV